MGFEPTTASLEGWNSTTELRPPTANLSTHQYFAAKASHTRPWITLHTVIISSIRNDPTD